MFHTNAFFSLIAIPRAPELIVCPRSPPIARMACRCLIGHFLYQHRPATGVDYYYEVGGMMAIINLLIERHSPPDRWQQHKQIRSVAEYCTPNMLRSARYMSRVLYCAEEHDIWIKRKRLSTPMLLATTNGSPVSSIPIITEQNIQAATSAR